MEHWEILVAAAALAAGMWSHIKSAFAWLRGLLIVTVWLDHEGVMILTSYAAVHGRRLSGQAAYDLTNYYVRSLGCMRVIPTEWLNKTGSLFWLHGRLISLRRADKPLIENHTEFQVSVIRGTLSVPKLLTTIADWAADGHGGTWLQRRHRVVYHYGATLTADSASRGENPGRPGSIATAPNVAWSKTNGRRLLGDWKPDDIGGSDAATTLEALVSMPNLMSLTEEVRAWYADRLWYREHGIPWRLGCAFAGEPGTGKTSHARGLAVELDLPVHVFDLASMSNADLRKAWAMMTTEAPCMALIEDIDAVFHGRENITPSGSLMNSGGLTFDALLNVIDGIERHDGVLLVVTTNHLDKIDPALRDRKGRVDKVVTFEPLDLMRRLELATRIIDNPLLAARTAHDSGDMPASKFAERCCSVALAARRDRVTVVEPVRMSEYR